MCSSQSGAFISDLKLYFASKCSISLCYLSLSVSSSSSKPILQYSGVQTLWIAFILMTSFFFFLAILNFLIIVWTLWMQEPWYISADNSWGNVGHKAMPAAWLPSSSGATRWWSHIWSMFRRLHELKNQIWCCWSQMTISSLNQKSSPCVLIIELFVYGASFVAHLENQVLIANPWSSFHCTYKYHSLVCNGDEPHLHSSNNNLFKSNCVCSVVCLGVNYMAFSIYWLLLLLQSNYWTQGWELIGLTLTFDPSYLKWKIPKFWVGRIRVGSSTYLLSLLIVNDFKLSI